MIVLQYAKKGTRVKQRFIPKQVFYISLQQALLMRCMITCYCLKTKLYYIALKSKDHNIRTAKNIFAGLPHLAIASGISSALHTFVLPASIKLLKHMQMYNTFLVWYKYTGF